jgi:DNA-binding transcriptional ArsR family regulator
MNTSITPTAVQSVPQPACPVPAVLAAAAEMPALGELQRLYRERARIIKALAHPTRLYIVDQLARAPRCVCELTARIGADVSTVSKHLAVLRTAGLVEDEKRGAQVWYHLCAPCILNFIGCVEGVITRNASEQAGFVRPAGGGGA